VAVVVQELLILFLVHLSLTQLVVTEPIVLILLAQLKEQTELLTEEMVVVVLVAPLLMAVWAVQVL
jgi:hypothetical protein